jgi:hypothetical protein
MSIDRNARRHACLVRMRIESSHGSSPALPSFPSWDRKTGCVTRSHRSLGSRYGPQDSVIDRGTRNRPKPREAPAEHPALLYAVASPRDPALLGGCEDLAMFNRTNQTLSALALSNRLNLGTRSLAANAGVNHGALTLSIRLSHHDVMREGMVWYVVSSISKPRYAIPAIPGSFSQVQQPRFSCATLQQVGIAADVRVESHPRPADLVDRLEPRVDDRDSRFRTTVPTERNTTMRALGCQPCSGLKSSRKHGLKPAESRATRLTAAAMSAVSGK